MLSDGLRIGTVLTEQLFAEHRRVQSVDGRQNLHALKALKSTSGTSLRRPPSKRPRLDRNSFPGAPYPARQPLTPAGNDVARSPARCLGYPARCRDEVDVDVVSSGADLAVACASPSSQVVHPCAAPVAPLPIGGSGATGALAQRGRLRQSCASWRQFKNGSGANAGAHVPTHLPTSTKGRDLRSASSRRSTFTNDPLPIQVLSSDLTRALSNSLSRSRPRTSATA